MTIGPRHWMGATLMASSYSPWFAAATAPSHGVLDVNLLIQEIEENLGTQVIDIPIVSKGSNNYVGFPFRLLIIRFYTKTDVGW